VQHTDNIPWVLWALALFFLCLGFTARIDIPLALLAATSIFAFSQEPDLPGWQQLARQHWPVTFFLVVAAITTATSGDWRHSLGVQPQLLPALLVYSVIAQFVNTPHRQRFVILTLLASGLLTVTLMITGIDTAGTPDPLEKIRMLGNALFIVPNDILMLSLIAPLTLTLLRERQPSYRILIGFFLLLSLFASTLMGSRQAVLVLLSGIAIFCTLIRPRWFVPALIIAALTGLLVDWLLGWPLLDKIRFFSRTYVWHAGWLMFIDSPLVGQGPGQFKDLYYPYLEKAGYILADLPDRRNMPWAHNLYLEQLAERGILGLVALLCLLFTALKRSWVCLRTATAGQEQIWLASGLAAALLALCLAGVAEATLSRLWVTVMGLTLVSLCTTLRPSSQNL
jgi:O-antigen ligase